MLEPIRQYALERLLEGGEAEETRRRHAAFFLSLAEEARPKIRSELEWLRRLDQENGNLRGAISWSLAADDIATAARLGWALWVYWWNRNRQPEGRRWLETILRRKEKLPPRLRARATAACGAMAYGQGDIEATERYIEEIIELSWEAGRDAHAEGIAHAGAGLRATARGDLEAAKKHLEVALLLLRDAGDDAIATQTRIWMGTVLLLQGDREGARGMFEEVLALGRSMGDRWIICNVLFNLAQLALVEGDYDTAFSRFAEGIVPSQETGARGNIAYILEGLGAVAGARGEAERAARLLGASEALISAIGLRGHTYYRPDRALYDQITAGVRSAMGDEAYGAAVEAGRKMTREEAVEYALETVEKRPAEAPPTGALPPETPSTGEPAQAAETGTTRVGLRIFALGAARVEEDGTPIDSPDWVLKSRELLYYLLSHPGGRTKERIGLALWPEASASQLRSGLRVTLFRLRRALGDKEWGPFEKGRYAFERSLSYSYDVEAFEGHLSEARRVRDQAPEQSIRHLKEAAGLYGGDFLEELAVEGGWALVRRRS